MFFVVIYFLFHSTLIKSLGIENKRMYGNDGQASPIIAKMSMHQSQAGKGSSPELNLGVMNSP